MRVADRVELLADESVFAAEAEGANLLSLQDCLERGLFRSPDSGALLSPNENGDALTDGVVNYPLVGESPLLYPIEIAKAWENGALPLRYAASAIQQYVLLSQIKSQGEINAPLDSLPYRKHQYRLSSFCKELKGLVLDVGSDRPSHSAPLFSTSCDYVGLDPYAQSEEFRAIGLGEILPFREGVFDAVVFNTSLDHMLDYHTALDEAYRVLRPGGSVVIASYAWIERATLLSDTVHFHHFREYQIVGALSGGFAIVDIKRYEDPKKASHRYGLYLRGEKKVPQGL